MKYQSTIESLEPRQFLSVGSEVQAVTTIGATSGATASAVRGTLSVGPSTLYFNAVKGQKGTYILRIQNIGAGRVTIPPGGITIVGSNASNFKVLDFPSVGQSFAPGKKIYVTVEFDAKSSQDLSIKTATLRVASNDPNNPLRTVPLRGLPTAGEGGSSEPSLQKIINLLNFPINTGQTNIESYLFPKNPSTPNDEVFIERFVKAGSGNVVIRPLAVFGNDSDPGVRLGTYTPGILDSEQYLWYSTGDTTQSVNPLVYGLTSFDPGSKEFGVVTQWPNFTNTDGSTRKVYSEDDLNLTWDSAFGHHTRFYPLKDQTGKVIPNAYVGAVEEYTQDYDQNDVVFVITNVKPSTSTPVLSYENVSGWPNNDVMSFNEIGTKDVDVGNIVRNKNTLRIRNSGTSDLIISTAKTGDYTIESGGGTNVVIPPGGKRDIVVRFTATSGATTHPGTLTITSNDPDHPTVNITLLGYWQQFSEFDANRRSVEPGAETIINKVFGYTTVIRPAGKSLNNTGFIQQIGDEILADYFVAADTKARVRVVTLANYHGMWFENANLEKIPTNSFMGWYPKGQSTNFKTILTDEQLTGQMILPYKDNSSTTIAAGNFNPGTQQFGFFVEKNEYSDPKLNPWKGTGDRPANWGQFLRFFPVYDSQGVLVPNSYFMLHDYNRDFTNYDFNDNVYLIENIIPVNQVKPVKTAVGIDTVNGPVITFTTPFDGPMITGFNIYRSTEGRGTYTKLNATALPRQPIGSFIDGTAAAGQTYFYRITSIGSDGKESQPVTVVV